MKRIASILAILLAAACTFSSCTYREYAPSEYPAPLLYIPAAVDGLSADGIYVIDADTDRCDLDADGRKLLIHLGVAVSGIERREFKVTLDYARSTVNRMIDDGTFPVGVLPLPDSVCSIPEELTIASDTTSAIFDLSVQVNYLKDPEFLGRKFAVAVRVSSEDTETNPDLETVVILIDPAFLLN